MRKLRWIFVSTLVAFALLTAVGHVVADQGKKKEEGKDSLKVPLQKTKESEDPAIGVVKDILEKLQKDLKKFDDLAVKFQFLDQHTRCTDVFIQSMKFAEDRELFENDATGSTIMLLVTSIDQYGNQVIKAQKKNDLSAAQQAAAHAERIYRNLSKELENEQKKRKK